MNGFGFDSVHPAVLAEKYHRPYRPYFLGQAGAASLNQYFGLQQILPEIENKQAVFVDFASVVYGDRL